MSSENSNSQEIQKKYVHLQMLSQQLAQLQEHLALIDAKVRELEELNKNIDEFKSWKKGKEVLAPLGINTFVKAELKNSSELIIGAGSNILLEKDPESAKNLNSSQVKELRNLSSQASSELSLLAQEQFQLEEELKELIEKSEKKSS